MSPPPSWKSEEGLVLADLAGSWGLRVLKTSPMVLVGTPYSPFIVFIISKSRNDFWLGLGLDRFGLYLDLDSYT